MKKLLWLLLLVSAPAFAGYTNGYYKQNGTYVEPYYRTTPDNNPYNNYTSPSTMPDGSNNYQKPVRPYGY